MKEKEKGGAYMPLLSILSSTNRGCHLRSFYFILPSVSSRDLEVRGFGFGDIFKDQPIKLRPRSMDVEGDKVSLSHTHTFVYLSL